MKKIIKSILLLTLVFLTSSVLAVANAASLKFDVPSVSTSEGETFEVQVIVDTGSEETNSIDAYIKFDTSVLEAQSVAEGTFYPTVLNDINSTRVYVAGLVDDPATSKSGTGTVATITFKALKSGSTTLTYECDPDVNESSKVIKNDIDATNIINCSENGSASVSVGGGSGDESTDSAGNGTGGTADELPQSGIFDNIVKFAVPGSALVLIGIALKMIL